jgi:hypothetical protein
MAADPHDGFRLRSLRVPSRVHTAAGSVTDEQGARGPLLYVVWRMGSVSPRVQCPLAIVSLSPTFASLAGEGDPGPARPSHNVLRSLSTSIYKVTHGTKHT